MSIVSDVMAMQNVERRERRKRGGRRIVKRQDKKEGEIVSLSQNGREGREYEKSPRRRYIISSGRKLGAL
jgi:hypothetical protein